MGAEVLTTACPATVVWVTLNGVNAGGCCCRTGGTFATGIEVMLALVVATVVTDVDIVGTVGPGVDM